MMEGMLIVTKQNRKPSHTRAMRSRLIAAAVSVATVLGLAVTGTAIADNVGTAVPEAAQSATTQASQAGTGPISGIAQGDSAQQGASSALTDRAGTGASGQTATVKASAAPRATANDSKVKINLFDYWDSSDPKGPAKAAGKENVNYATGGTSRNEAAAAFYFNYFNGKGKDWNGWTGSAETSPGIVKTNLTKTGADAVPQFSTMVTNKNNAQTDMTYLFTESEWAKAYTNGGNGLTGLFDPTEEAKGHYVYDSNTTYAALNSAGTGFDRSATWTERTDAWIPKFLPFNADKSKLRIGFHSVNGARYAFGMTAYAKFMQPKEGKLVDDSPMTFNFTGDDDLWLFVDGMLVLDIGGIHDAASGSINFVTGVVTIVNNKTTTTTLQALFTQALKDQGKSDAEITAWMESNMVKASNGSYTTFKNYTSHEMNMYYFERGHYGSNCKLDFNLVTLDSSHIQIGKETENVPEADKDKNYTFNAYVNYEGTDSDKDYTLYTGKYDVYNTATGTKDGETRTTDSNGVITLKAGQYAVLLGSDAKRITESSKYKVTEINVDQATYAVSANGGQVKVTQEKDSATTEPVSVGEVPRTTVTNTVVTAPRYRKYIKANNDGTYDLFLNVTGTQSGSSQTTVSPADIVVVFDTSSSMSGSMGHNSRLEVAKTAVNSMAQHLLTSENQGKDSNIRMALVPFSTTVGNVLNFTDNAMDIVSAVNGLGADGGTNWEAALKAANAKLTSGRKGVKKYIVFMSDGDPTYRTSSVRTGTDWLGRPIYDADDGWGLPAGVHGSGSSDQYGANLSSAVAEANRRGDATLFSVGVSSDPIKMRGFADQTKGSYYSATSTDELNKAFADIIGQINRKSSYKNVSITDTLSDYAEFVNANFGSNDVTVTASKDGNSVDLNESDYTVTVSGKTVKVTFADGYELQDGVTYTVTFKAKPTQKAYNEYAANKQNDDKTGYKDVLGADDTDADGHHTSSNLPGFHSNADHGAKLEYTVVNTVGDHTAETPGSVEYPHPVLQVKTGKIQVTKNWSDGAEKHGNDSVTVTLKQCNAQGEDCKDINRTVTLNNQGQWAGAFENLAPGTYRVEESSVDGYTASYDPENQLVTFTADDLWAAPDNNNMTTFDNVKTYPVTITNTRNTVDLVAGSVKVTKTVQGSSTDNDFSFTLKSATDDPNASKVIWPDGDSKQLTTSITGHFNAGESKTSVFAGKLTFPAEEATYKFVVTEDDAADPPVGWKYDTSERTITVDVRQGDDGTWSAAATPDMAEFTNTFVAVSALPMTGGATTRDWLVYGGGFGLLAALVGIGYFIWRKRRLV